MTGSLTNVRVCSDHFRKRQPVFLCECTDLDWVPSVALGHSELQQTPDTSRHERSMARNAKKRSTEEGLATEEENVTEDLEMTESNVTNSVENLTVAFSL